MTDSQVIPEQKPMLLDSLLAFEEVVMQPTLARKSRYGRSGGSVTWRYVRIVGGSETIHCMRAGGARVLLQDLKALCRSTADILIGA